MPSNDGQMRSVFRSRRSSGQIRRMVSAARVAAMPDFAPVRLMSTTSRVMQSPARRLEDRSIWQRIATAAKHDWRQAPASRWGSRTGPRLEYGWGQRDTLLEDYLVIASSRLFKIMANGCHEGVDEFLMLRCATAGDLQTLAPASPVP